MPSFKEIVSEGTEVKKMGGRRRIWIRGQVLLA